jgi:hypothetical protein
LLALYTFFQNTKIYPDFIGLDSLWIILLSNSRLIGATNPANAEAGTIRKLYARSLESNAVHGSDSDENASIEGSFFFAGTEQF